MTAVTLAGDDLEALAAELLVAAGAPPEPARWVAELLVRAEAAGHGSHGLRLLPKYARRCRAGEIRADAEPVIERDEGATLALDGRLAFGQVAARSAVDLAVERARRHGVAVVTLRRSGHTGRLADYVERAAAAGAIAIMAANDSGASQVVAPHGSLEPRLATNPIAVGIPRARPPHLVLDIATSVASSGEIELRKALGNPIPASWAVGETLLPAAGHKGYGLALVVDVLAGVLSGAGFSEPEPGPDHQGVWVLALDVEHYLPLERFAADVERLLAYVRSAGPDVRVPGEGAAQRSDGLLVPAPVWAEIESLCNALGVAVPVTTT